MSNYIRPKMRGAAIFFTVALARRSSDLLIREVGRLRQAVHLTRQERPIEIVAWVVLPDHLHAVWILPEDDRGFGVRWGAIKSRFTRSLRDNCRVGFNPTVTNRTGRVVGYNPTLRRSASKEAKGDAGIWQRRFWEHHIRDPADFDTHVRYCWSNPVKHGFVKRAVDWPYSSIHRDIRLGRVEPEWSGVVPEGAFGE